MSGGDNEEDDEMRDAPESRKTDDENEKETGILLNTSGRQKIVCCR